MRREAFEPPEPLTLVAVRAEPDCRSAGASAPALSLLGGAGWRLEFGALPPAAWLAELLAWLACSKFLDHLPLYRLEQIGARSNVPLPRSTLASWVGAIGVALQPLADRLAERLRCGQVLHADETPVAQLDPGRGKTLRAYLWAYRSNDLEGGPPPIVVFDYQCSRAGAHARAFLS